MSDDAPVVALGPAAKPNSLARELSDWLAENGLTLDDVRTHYVAGGPDDYVVFVERRA